MDVEENSNSAVAAPVEKQSGGNPLNAYRWFTGSKLSARRSEGGEEPAASARGVAEEGDPKEAAGATEAPQQDLQGGGPPETEGDKAAADREGAGQPNRPSQGEGPAVRSKKDNLSKKSSYQRAQSEPTQSARGPGTLRKVKSDSAERIRRLLTSFSHRLSRKRSSQELAVDQSQQDNVDTVSVSQTQTLPISLVPSAGVPVWDVNNCTLVNGQLMLMSKDDESACRIRMRTSSCISDTSLSLSQNW
ncbi:uncharacterized protein LOC144489515, partial [Mustelus asterias]